MESQLNCQIGARHRSFEINDAIFAKDCRGQKPIWTPGFINLYCSLWKRLSTRHVNQLRSRTDTTATKTFVDVFDLLLREQGRWCNAELLTRLNDRNASDHPTADYRWTHEELDTR
ncbi:hypothetical protein RB195_023412 [Necator americanus]